MFIDINNCGKKSKYLEFNEFIIKKELPVYDYNLLDNLKCTGNTKAIYVY